MCAVKERTRSFRARHIVLPWAAGDGSAPACLQRAGWFLSPRHTQCPPTPSNIPNRSTFACPYCGARNLDQQELVKHCVESHRSDPNRVVSSGGIGLLPEGDAGTGLVSGMGHLKWRVLCMPYYEWVGGRAGRREPLPATPNFFSRYAPSAQQCPGGTPATKAPTSCSICCTGTSSPTTPSW